jgi:hypothetical protein
MGEVIYLDQYKREKMIKQWQENLEKFQLSCKEVYKVLTEQIEKSMGFFRKLWNTMNEFFKKYIAYTKRKRYKAPKTLYKPIPIVIENKTLKWIGLVKYNFKYQY